MVATITGLSSMATRMLLAALAETVEQRHRIRVQFSSGGGVEVAQRIRDGADADLAVLADGAMARLEADGFIAAGSRVLLFASPVVAAVPATAEPPLLATEDDFRAALAGAHRIAYSTGPSGTELLSLLERWGIDATERLLQAPPGIPVGSLLADGQADLGFQQLSELMDVAGITVMGPLPGAAAIRSTFAGGVLASSRRPAEAATVLDALADPETAGVVRAYGMTLHERATDLDSPRANPQLVLLEVADHPSHHRKHRRWSGL